MKALAASALAILLTVPAFAGDGAATFKTKCAGCHGADGTGLTPMGRKMSLRDLGSAGVQKQTDAELNALTSNGKGKMPAYKDKLSGAEIKDLVTFMRTLKK